MIYFVRHGQTQYNLEKRSQGQLDVPLNETGMEEARKVSQKLKDYKFDLIYCSTLSRARQTADEINKYHNVPIIYDARLMERHAGRRQGYTFFEAPKDIQDLWNQDASEFGGEGKKQIYDRSVEVFKEIEQLKKDVLIVSHGGVWKALYKYLNKISPEQSVEHEFKNCEVDILKSDY